MIGEYKTWRYLYARHVASHARIARDLLFVARSGVALRAGGIISGALTFQRRVRRVTSGATQAALTLIEAAARGERQRLVPRVPWIAEIGRITRCGGHAMTGNRIGR